MKNIILLILFIFISNISISAILKGKIVDENNKPLPFASVYIKNTTYGVSADYNGKYFIELKPGTYTIVFSFIGYKTKEKKISLSTNQTINLDIILKNNLTNLNEIEVVANKEDKAKKILDNVRANRKLYLHSYDNYKCDNYIKTTIEKQESTNLRDSLLKKGVEIKTLDDFFKKQNLNLIESVSEIYFKQPSKYKEIVKAYNDYTEPKKPNSRSISISVEVGEDNIAPETKTQKNPNIFYENISDANFNFYKNLIKVPSLCNQPLKSPISNASGIDYKFRFIESFYENGKKINKIEVIPRNKVSALFYGEIFIEDSTWALLSVDLSINERALLKYKNFRIIENYKQIKPNVYLPNRVEITYTIKNRKSNILGCTKISNKNYKIDIDIDKNLFNNEIKTFEPKALDQDSTYWKKIRPIALKNEEIKFISKTDSIKEYYTSDKFLDRQDSLYNALHWWSIFAGAGYQNHYNGINIFVGGLIQQVVPFGVGGYRHKLPISFSKELKNKMILETTEEADYGFLNNDLKGKFSLGLMYYPKKFIKTTVSFGNYYDLINNYASIEQTFSRSNYVNDKSIGISQRIEIFNGLFAKFSFDYNNQNPITDIKLEKWSNFVFGDLNKPVDFNQYIKSEFTLKLKYVINQQYVIKENKKIIIGKDYPEINFTYRKGFPNLFNSEVDFDYFEIGANDELKLARFGLSRWQIKFGTFTNKRNLRILEYKYFRGSDKYFFSDPVKSFQLLGPTLNTANEFIQANYIHHFNGSILNQVPLFKYLKMSIAGGAGTMSIPRDNFAHFEMFAGVEKIFRIKDQLFRLGFYGVSSDNTLTKKPEITIKIGISDFNSYTNKWSY